MYGNLSMGEAFAQADNVLTTAAKGIAEIIMRTGYINVDFEDVRTVMTDGGVAIMGTGVANGDNRAIEAAEKAMSSPLLNDNKIAGAKFVLLNIGFGTTEPKMDEITDITDFIQDEAGDDANVIWGYGQDERLDDSISVTMIATGFDGNTEVHTTEEVKRKKVVHTIDLDEPKESPSNQNSVKGDAPTENNEVQLVNNPEKKAEQANLSFDEPKKLSNESAPKAEEPKLITPQTHKPAFHTLDEDEPVQPQRPVDTVSEEERSKRNLSRLNRLKDLSRILRTPSGIQDLESEPAYKRKKLKLDDTPHSSESQVSRYTISETETEDGEKKTEIRSNNSFLHDNVD